MGLTLNTSIKHLQHFTFNHKSDRSCAKMSALYVGQVFESINGFKEALRNWAILDHFEYYWPFSDSQRCKAVCVHKNCDFTVRCNAYLDQDCAKVTVLVVYHNCASNAPIA
jgi:hypothetical protein